MRRSKERVVVRGQRLRSAAICCALGVAGLVSASDAVVTDAPAPESRAVAPLPDGPERQSLADILGFDPVAVDASREKPRPPKREPAQERPAARSTQETLDRYEAQLLADRRVAYGVTRTVDGPQTRRPTEKELLSGKSRQDQAPATTASVRNANVVAERGVPTENVRAHGIDAALAEPTMIASTAVAHEEEINPDVNVFILPDEEETEPTAATQATPSTIEVPVAEQSQTAQTYGDPNALASANANVQYPQSAINFKGKTFNSSAYSGDVSVDAVVKEETREEPQTLELDDVEEFSHEQESAARDEDDDALGENAFQPPVDPGADTVAALQDECYAALDPYTSLFIAYDPTYEWTESILEYVDSILTSIEESPEQTRALIVELKRRTQEADAIKTKLKNSDAIERGVRDPWNGGEQPTLSSRYTLAQRLELVDSFKSALERRIFLWNHAADYFAARNKGELHESQDLTRQEMELLLKATKDVRDFFGDTANGKSWRASFDVDAAIAEIEQTLALPGPEANSAYARSRRGKAQDPATVGYLGKLAYSSTADRYLDEALANDAANPSELEKERARRMQFLHDRINAIAYKIEKTPMTQTQRQVFQRPVVAEWSNLVAGLAGDQLNGMPLLVAFEKYERTAGGHSGRSLQQLALRMTTSQSEVCRLYGRAIDVIYDNPNVKAYVSEALINRMLPVRDPEFEVVQETVLNNPVVGQRRVDTQVSITLKPDPNRLLMSLNINGRMHANTSSAVMSAKLHNESYAHYVGQKTLEWRDTGIAYSPASVNASSAARLNAVETDVDFVPLVGDLARGVARSQYESQQGAIEAETRAKVIRQTQMQFDREANSRFDAVNAKMRAGFFRNLSNLGLSLRTQRSRTTDDWLLASLRFGADYALGCQATEPPTLEGAFADVKLHESSINSFLTQLDLAGRTLTPEQTLEYLAVRLNKPKLKEVQIEKNELSFTFAKADPVAVRFLEDKICLALRFANLKLGDKSWDDIEVEIAYRPTLAEDGAPALVRDGTIALYGPASVMEQIPIRTVFSKIFPAQKSIDLRAEALQQDERFAGLALGLCRVSKGWFAISVIKDPGFHQELEKTYLQ